MNPKRDQLDDLFDEAQTLTRDEQNTLIDQLQERDPAMAAELSALLTGHDRDEHTPTTADPFERAAHIKPDPSIGAVIADRYRLDQRIGAGGVGRVYRAYDQREDRVVAVKLLRADRMHDKRQVLRFRREFRAISRLDHPGCLRVFDEGVHRSQRYIVAEYVSGGDLSRLVGAPDTILLPVMIQLAATLDYIHGERIVHRDLKPANVLLAPGPPPTPRLADFGIVKLVDDINPRITAPGAVIGTLDYLSPEQLEAKPIDPRSDLYSLGCIMYKLWSGSPPFTGVPLRRLRARLTHAAPSLADRAPHAPARLVELVARLLARDPADRPQRASDVARALIDIHADIAGEQASERVLHAWPGPSVGGFLYPAGLVGRDALRAELVALADDMACNVAGAPMLVGLCGELGIGKTALMTSVANQLGARGFRAFTINMSRGTGAPFAPFPELAAQLDHALQGIGPDAETASEFDAALADGPPRDWSPAWLLPLDEGMLARRRLVRDLIARMLALHGRQPVAVFLEDLHSASHAALTLLVELLDELAHAASDLRPVLFAAMRPAGRDALVATLTEAAADRTSVALIAMDPLAPGAVIRIIAAMLGVAHDALPDGLVAHLTHTCGGNPLLVQSGLRALVDSGYLRQTRTGWALHTDELRSELPGAAVKVLRERLDALSEPTRRVLRAACVTARAFDIDLLRHTTGLDEDAVIDAIDEALRASVFTYVGTHGERDEFAFEHSQLADVLYKGLSDEARAAGHDAMGRALRDRGHTASAMLAYHFARGRDPELAYHYSREAGRAATSAHDYEAAADHWRTALDVIDRLDGVSDDERQAASVECRETLADALVAIGRTDEAIEQIRALTDLPAELPVHSRWLRKLGSALLRTPDVAGGLAMMERALDVLGDHLPRSRVGRYWRLARDMIAAFVRRRLRRKPRRDSVTEERALAHRELAFMNRWVDLERSVTHLIAFRRLAERLGVREYLVDAYAGAATIYAFLVWPRRAAHMDHKARELAHASEDKHGLARIEILRAGTETILRHNAAAAIAHFDEGLRIAESIGDRFLINFALVQRGYGGVILDRWAQSAEDFDRGARLAEEVHIPWLRVDAACGRSLVSVVIGEFDNAVRTAREVLTSDMRLALPVLEALANEILGGEAFMNGRFRDAAAYFSRSREHYAAHRLDRGWGFLIDVEHSEALLCLVDEQGEDAVPDLAKQLDHDARLANRRLGRLPLYHGCDLVLRGVCQARKGNARSARKLFARARTIRAGSDYGATYMDTWLKVRIAIESWRLGDSRADVTAEFDEIDAMYKSLGLTGMRVWLKRMREIHGV